MYGFDDNFDVDLNENGTPQQKKNMFSDLMGGEASQPKTAMDDFPDFSTSNVQNRNSNNNNNNNNVYNNNNAWDDDDFWKTGPSQPTAQANYGGGGGFDMAALRGNTKPEKAPPKPFHLDSMSMSYFDRTEDQRPQGYSGQEVLEHTERYEESPYGQGQNQNQGASSSYQNQQAERPNYFDNYEEPQHQQDQNQYQDNYGNNYDHYDHYDQQQQQQNTHQNDPQYDLPYQARSKSPEHVEHQQYDHYEADQHRQSDNTGGYSPNKNQYNEDYSNNNQYNNNQYQQEQAHHHEEQYNQDQDHHEQRIDYDVQQAHIEPPVSVGLEVESKGIQKTQTAEPAPVESKSEAQPDHEQILQAVAQKEDTLSERSQSVGGNPRAIGNGAGSLDIRCSIHRGQYIERVCTHPRYTRKRLLCWECGMDESKEIQKFRHSLEPITQYALNSIKTFANNEGPKPPAELEKSLSRLDSTRESFIQDLKVNIDSFRGSLDLMRQQINGKFDEIDQAIQDVAHGKVNSLDANKDFFAQAILTYYPNNAEEKPSQESLLSSLSSIRTEKNFDEFMNSLKPKADPTTPEVKNYLRVLSHKIDSQELRYPNKENFRDIHTRNLKVMQLQEQIMTNLEGIKGTLSDLINSSYHVEDITKTRLVTPKNLTQDCLATLTSMNNIAHEQLRYRLHYEKKFSVPEPKRVTCVANIDNEIIAAGSLDKTITFWSIEKNELLETIAAHDDAISGLYTYKVCMADLKNRVPQTSNFNEDAVTLLVSTGGKFDNSILFWDVAWMHDYIHGKITEKQRTKVIRRLEGQEAGITAVLPMVDGATLISGEYNGKISVWNTLKGKVVGEIHHHTAAVSCLRLIRDNERYASASWDKTICIWRIFYKELYDPETGIQSERRLFEGFEMEKIIDPSFKIMCMNASLVQKNWLVFGGSINRVIVWDIDAGKLVKEFECENNNLAEIALVEDEQKDKMIIMGICDDDDVVRGWDTNYQESEGLLREAYNLKIRSKLYASKTSVNGSLLQLVQDGRLRMGVVNCAENRDLVSLWEMKFGM